MKRPERFVVRYEGVDSLDVDEDCRQVMKTRLGELAQTAPVAWQTLADGSHSPIDCHFRLIGVSCHGFEVGALDPQIDYATYVGGDANTRVYGPQGNRVALAVVLDHGWLPCPSRNGFPVRYRTNCTQKQSRLCGPWESAHSPSSQ